MSRVLLVEDEDHLALGLRFNLENAGYEVRLARTGKEALLEVERGAFDLIILDVSLPGDLDGVGVAKHIRRAGNFIPIVMLTARDTLDDRIRGLDAGADDYVPKPFDLDELLARVRGLLRRQIWERRRDAADQALPASAEDGAKEALVFGPCSVDFHTWKAVGHDGAEVQLSSKEAAMMKVFAQEEGKVIPRGMFLEKVWNEPSTMESRTVDNFVMRLRRIFEKDPKQPRHILSVRGVGYRFVK